MRSAPTSRRQRETLTLDVDGTYRLRRLTDDEYDRLRKTSIAIEPVDYWLEWRLCKEAGFVNLGEFYASLKHLFGERGLCFDDWKCSFAFPLALDIPGVSRSPAYVMMVIDVRGGVEHQFRKVVKRSDPRLKEPLYYPPDRKEFPLGRMEYFVSFFVGYQKGRYVGERPRRGRFLLTVPSEGIVYGHDGRRFFARNYESERRFKEETKRLRARLPVPGCYPGRRGS